MIDPEDVYQISASRADLEEAFALWETERRANNWPQDNDSPVEEVAAAYTNALISYLFRQEEAS